VITTSWALTVLSFHLANNPDIAAKLRDELKTQEEPYDWHKLEKLPYLNGCIHETIRLSHGIVTRDPRLAPDTALQYGKWTIPPNTPVSMTTVDILMNETIFPEPRSFRPERWEQDPELEKYFVPFGKGSRMCLGIK
jgi:cytochrome P450